MPELLLANGYTPPSRQQRKYHLYQLITRTQAQAMTTAEGISIKHVRRYFAYLRELPD